MSTSMTQFDLDYANACRLLLISTERIGLVLIGCGGTGSWLAPSVARIGRILMEKFTKEVEIYFIDPDKVEAKNCFRQNFCPAEIGRNKAECLAFRYSLAWGVLISAIAEPFDPKFIHNLYRNYSIILIGCVDNPAARKAIKKAAESRMIEDYRTWWLDCGNHHSAGQVLLGCGTKEPKNPFEFPGLCSWLPLPADQHPELLEAQEIIADPQEGLSCADLAMIDSQGLAINQRIAAEATDYLVRMLLTKDLMKMATYIDLASGSTRSKYINPGSVSIETVEVA
jgi:PRTRC genetic system ThiF family protein